MQIKPPAPRADILGDAGSRASRHARCRAKARTPPNRIPRMTSRRSFIQILPLAGALALGARPALADAPKVDEKDPQAVALGYVADAARVDKAKFAKYTPGQACASCQLYQGKATDPTAPCAIFAGKQVAGKGWCSAYVKKA
jgi:hypothetical protein